MPHDLPILRRGAGAGIIKATQSAGLYFTSGSPDAVVNAAESLGLCSMGDGAITLDCSHVFRRTQTAPAAVCRTCRKIILDYSPEAGR